jgi:hypothetical protein
MFFKTLGKVTTLPESFLELLPGSTYSARKLSNNKREQFVRYVSCPDCHYLYAFDECIVKTNGGQIEPKICSYIRFPAHPQSWHRKPCGGQLVKKVEGKIRGFFFIPAVLTAIKV